MLGIHKISQDILEGERALLIEFQLENLEDDVYLFKTVAGSLLDGMRIDIDLDEAQPILKQIHSERGVPLNQIRYVLSLLSGEWGISAH